MTCSIRNLLIFKRDCGRSQIRVLRTTSSRFGRLLGLALAAGLFVSGTRIADAQESIISRGDGVVTGFSGIKSLDAPTKPGADPLDEFFIDLEGASMQRFARGEIDKEEFEERRQILNA